MARTFDFLVIGAGAAGAATAAFLARAGRVAVLEQESQPGYHSTSRSAAVLSAAYGPTTWQILTAASAAFYAQPPEDFADTPLTRPRGALFLAAAKEADALATHAAILAARGVRCALLSPDDAKRLAPVVHMDGFERALHEPDCVDLDASALLQGYLRVVRRGGGVLLTGHGARAIARRDGVWRVATAEDAFEAPVLVNAAGAWADEVAALAGLPRRNVVPLRRTAITFDPPADHDAARWPMTFDMAETWYFKPEGRHIMMSPADLTPSPPCDAQPEELDVAIAIDRIETATTLKVGRLASRWAGLRTFAPDHEAVIGSDPVEPTFIWCAGQGGNGVMASAAAGELTAAFATGAAMPRHLATLGLTEDAISPARLAPAD